MQVLKDHRDIRELEKLSQNKGYHKSSGSGSQKVLNPHADWEVVLLVIAKELPRTRERNRLYSLIPFQSFIPRTPESAPAIPRYSPHAPYLWAPGHLSQVSGEIWWG